MKIAVVGAGNVARPLALGWSSKGHEVTLAVRDPGAPRVRRLVEESGDRLVARSVRDAAAAAEVVVLATPWSAVEEALLAAGDLAGKVLLDCTNPLTPDLSGLTLGHATSGGERVAALAAGARVVKIFNTTGAANMERPDYGGTPVSMLHAGDDDAANAVAAGLARDIGFEPVLLGPLAAARLLEPFALVWITLAFQRGLGPDFCLQVLARP